MVEDDRIGFFDEPFGLFKFDEGSGVVALLEMEPAEGVGDGPALGIEGGGFEGEFTSLFKLLATLDPHVGDVIEDRGLESGVLSFGIALLDQVKRLAEKRLGLVKLSGAFMGGGKAEIEGFVEQFGVVFGKCDGLFKLADGVGPALGTGEGKGEEVGELGRFGELLRRVLEEGIGRLDLLAFDHESRHGGVFGLFSLFDFEELLEQRDSRLDPVVAELEPDDPADEIGVFAILLEESLEHFECPGLVALLLQLIGELETLGLGVLEISARRRFLAVQEGRSEKREGEAEDFHRVKRVGISGRIRGGWTN